MTNRRKPTDLYQVDFVAALFSGFLLIWLVGIGSSDVPTGEGISPKPVEISGTALYTRPNGQTLSLPVLPLDAVLSGCAPVEIIKILVSAGSKLKTCIAQKVQALNSPEKSEYFITRVALARRADPLSEGMYYETAGIKIELRSSNNDARAVQVIGTAVRKTDLYPAAVTSVAVGLITSDMQVDSVQILEPAAVRGIRYSVIVKQKNRNNDPLEIEDYAFLETQAIGYDGYKLSKIVIRVTMDAMHCHQIELKPNDYGSVKLNGGCVGAS